MRALEFWKAVVMDETDFIEGLTSVLSSNGIRYCVIDGQGVNAYVEPLVSLDLDLVIATPDMQRAEKVVAQIFRVERFPHSLNLSAAGSQLRVQIQTDPRYGDFVDRAQQRNVLGLQLPVADVEDILRGKTWAAGDSDRRPSKQRKDLLDIERLLEAYPHLRPLVPQAILDRLDR